MYLEETARLLSSEARVLIGVKGIVTVPNPAAGVDWSQEVPGGEQWRILAGQYTFTTSAAVANRLATFIVTVDGARVWRGWDNTTIAAGNSNTYTLVEQSAAVVPNHGNGLGWMPFPSVWLPPGATFGSLTGSLDVLDTLTNINLYVERVYLTDQQLGMLADEREHDIEDAIKTLHGD